MSLPSPHPPRLRLVFDPEDHIEHHRELMSAHNLGEGRVVCQLKGGRQRVTVLAASVLEGLGKDLNRRGNHASSALNWRRCEVWLRAEGVGELVALRAQNLEWRGFEHMARLAVRADCGLTLVVSGCSELDKLRERAVSQFPFERVDFAQWQGRYGREWTTPATGPVAADCPRAFPPVPNDDFTVFRAACRRCLDGTDFATVDTCWRSSFAEARAWVVDVGVLDETVVFEYLEERTRTASSYGEVLTRLRGAQAALFHAGWLVKVNHERFISGALQEPHGLLTAENATLLRGFVPPRFAAAATLAMVLRSPTELLTGLRHEDVDESGAAVRTGNSECSVPSFFQPFLRALWLERVEEGARPGSPLFIAPDGKLRKQDQQMSVVTMQETLRLVTRETGLLVVREFTNRKLSGRANNWAHRRGVSVAAIIDDYALALKTKAKAA